MWHIQLLKAFMPLRYLRKSFFLLLIIGTVFLVIIVEQLMTKNASGLYENELFHNKLTNLFQHEPGRLMKQIFPCEHKEKSLIAPNCTRGNPFVKTRLSMGTLKMRGKHLTVLSYRVRNHAHSGLKLVPVRDPETGRSCTFTNDMNLLRTADVVIIPARAMKGDDKMPSMRGRHPEQRWVFYTSESFLSVRPDMTYRHAFNHTMTYHQHADIYSSRFGFHPEENPAMAAYDVISTKTSGRLVAWMSSHCPTFSRREDFVEKLSRYVKVDVYGKCGDLRCPKDEWCQETLSEYKFYVAFENSLCNGYISEKPWIGFSYNSVPLVAGAGSDAYQDVLPPNSYIDVEHFKSVEEVANYLQILDANDTLYEEYFAWRTHYKIGAYGIGGLSSQTCQYLHKTKNNGPHKVDVLNFARNERGACHMHKNTSWIW